MQQLIEKLDLIEYVDSLNALFSREKPIVLEGDINLHHRYIKALSQIEFASPPPIKNIDTQLTHLKKYGTLKLYEVIEFVKIIRYFLYLRGLKIEGLIKEWMDEINFPESVLEAEQNFDKHYEIKEGIIEKLDSVNAALKTVRENIRTQLSRNLNAAKLQPYLVDKQIYYINEEEALLVRGGFNHVIKASVIGRTPAGFFYIIPESVSKQKDRESELLSRQEEIIMRFCKEISSSFGKLLKFWKWLNKEFDKFDHYQARVQFARQKDLHFILPKKENRIILKSYKHPALHDPVPVDIDFSKQVLMLTGVNAGGKTMLLKSILSSVFCAKYLIPMQADPEHTRIGSFKEIVTILDDPQNVKNDISTFAGRMVDFSKLFSKRDLIAGVDEIELGTDSDEAASLFKVTIEELIKRGMKIIITTHHKRLAALMAGHDHVELVAALYDEKLQKPTYTFLQGTIGKSYAFETAERYGIPHAVVREARKLYGEDKERLNELIEKSSALERDLERKRQALQSELDQAKTLRIALEAEKDEQRRDAKKRLAEWERDYADAIEAAKKAAKENSQADIHRQINTANKMKEKIVTEDKTPAPEWQIGDRVKHGGAKGVIAGLTSKEATVETDEGIRFRIKKNLLKRSGPQPKVHKHTNQVTVQKPGSAQVKLDLHGLRAEEAIEKLDKFLSDSLIAGYDEVLVYHGIGTGKLAYAVKTFLLEHPSVVEFSDAPPSMGGFGAKLIRL